jgi:hypothetical protein
LPKAPADASRKKDGFDGLVARLAPGLIDQLVDAFVTPEGLAALIADPSVAREAKAKDPAALARMQDGPKELHWDRVRYAFFTGPATFLVNIDEIKLRFAVAGARWRLKTIELPPGE